MKLVVVTCLWKRPVIADRVLARLASAKKNLESEVDLDLVAVGSEGEASAELARRNGFHYVEFANKPLGAKWNRGAAEARKLGADAIVIVGSDDWLSDGILRYHNEHLQRGVELLTFRDTFIVCEKMQNCRRYAGPTAVGRSVHKSLLDQLDWELWKPESNSRLDAWMDTRLKKLSVNWHWRRCMSEVEGGAIMSMKSETNIWPFRTFASKGKEVSVEEVLSFFPPSEVADLLSALGSPDLVERQRDVVE